MIYINDSYCQWFSQALASKPKTSARVLLDLVMPPFRLSAWGFEAFEDLKLSYFC